MGRQQDRKGEEAVANPHEDFVNPAAIITGDQS